jgi:hypothetical protein
MSNGFLNLSWWAWSGLALLVALVFAAFVPAPERVYAASGFTFVVARWFHSLVWLLLSLSFALRAFESAAPLANPVAALAGVVYLVYLVTTLSLPAA